MVRFAVVARILSLSAVVAITFATVAESPAEQPRTRSAGGRYVLDLRYYGQLTEPYVAETTTGTTTRIGNPYNGWYEYAAYTSAYAEAFDDLAGDVRYGGGDFAHEFQNYRYWRYWQGQYSTLTAIYVYYALLFDYYYFPTEFNQYSYDAGLKVYTHAYTAGNYALADFETP